MIAKIHSTDPPIDFPVSSSKPQECVSLDRLRAASETLRRLNETLRLIGQAEKEEAEPPPPPPASRRG